MKSIQKLIFLGLTIFSFSSATFAQAKTEKEIVIVKKIIDKDGNETEEKIVLKGEEAEKYLKENSVQVKETVTEKDGEKEMTIEVTAEGEGYQEMTITVDDEGGEHKMMEGDKMIFIEGDGKEIPEDIKKMLLEKGVNIDSLINAGQTEMEVKESQHYKVVEIDDDGNKKVIEWTGEGEMPEEMKEIMDEHGIESKTIKKQIMVVEDEDIDVSSNGEMKIIKIRKEKDGEKTEEVFELDADAELPKEVQDILEEHGIDLGDLEKEGQTRIKIEIEEDGEGMHKHNMSPNKAQLGVMVDENNGVRVADFIKNGAAKSAGVKIDDYIVKVDKIDITNLESLMNALSGKKPGDVVKLKVKRNGKTKKIKVTLKASEASATSATYRFEPSSSTATNYRTEHKVLKIKGGDINQCDPNESVTKKVSLTDKEIEIVEEHITEETGLKQVTVVSGSNTLEIGEIDLFPNPTDGSIRVRFQIDNQEETKVQIIDIAGRALYENTISDFSGVFDEEIDLSGKGMGTLVLIIAQGDKAFTEKILLN